MLALSEAFASIRDFMELGGDVLWAVMLVLFLMWTLILERVWYFRAVAPGRIRATVAAWDKRADTTSWYAKQIRDAMISDVSTELKKGLPMIKTLVAVCPLLGLLGTVTGMISVFDVMGITGTSNARAMAAGVAKATVPTMAGMVAALSGVLFAARLDRKADTEAERLEDLMQHH